MGFNYNVFLGNREAALDAGFLRAAGIRFILCCAGNHDPKMQRRIEGIQYLHLSLQDKEIYSLISYIEPSLIFVLDALRLGERVLIHCISGISRYKNIYIPYCLILFT